MLSERNLKWKQQNGEELTMSVPGTSEFDMEVVMTQGVFLLENGALRRAIGDRRCLVVISETVQGLYGSRIGRYFRHFFKPDAYRLITVPTGEANKTMATIEEICRAGKEFGLDRRSVMVAIGGGILMDMVGFAASMYKRKIDYLRVPTTLVGQIDAGIGIKTGINFDRSKNFLGSYHAPLTAINDLDLLATLSEDDVRCGVAEIIKMGLIVDRELFELVEAHVQDLVTYKFQKEPDVAIRVHSLAIQRMLEQLQVNFYERDLERLVDFGHTFSPFIEEHTNYQIPHGIAVGMDMAISTELAFLQNMIDRESRDRILRLLSNLGIPLEEESAYLPTLMWKSLRHVELHRGMKLNLVVPTGIGSATFIREKRAISEELLAKACEGLRAFRSSAARGDRG